MVSTADFSSYFHNSSLWDGNVKNVRYPSIAWRFNFRYPINSMLNQSSFQFYFTFCIQMFQWIQFWRWRKSDRAIFDLHGEECIEKAVKVRKCVVESHESKHLDDQRSLLSGTIEGDDHKLHHTWTLKPCAVSRLYIAFTLTVLSTARKRLLPRLQITKVATRCTSLKLQWELGVVIVVIPVFVD